jgi:hypothetical protein
MSSGAKSRGELLDYRTYLTHQLTEARSRIKWMDVGVGLAILAVGAISYLLTVIIMDQLFTLPGVVRLALLVLFSAVTFGYIGFAVIAPVVRRVNLFYAIQQVERANPEFRNSLLNWATIQEHGAEEIPEPILKAIESRAASDLSKIDLREAIHSQHVLRAATVLLVVVTVFAIYAAFFTHKSLSRSLTRVLYPLADVAPPTETRLTGILPGDTEIPAGDPVKFEAYTAGKAPEQVVCHVASIDGSFWEPNPLTAPTEPGAPWRLTIYDQQRTFDYYLAANDFKSDVFKVRVIPSPTIKEWKLTYHYPNYTGMQQEVRDVGDIDAVEGTKVVVSCVTNVKLRASACRIALTIGGERSLIPMTVDGEHPERMQGEIILTADGTYSIDFEDETGRKPRTKPIKTIRVQRDLPPTIAFVEPADVEATVPVDGTATFRITAGDDFGLDQVRLQIRKQGNKDFLLNEGLIKPGAWPKSGVFMGTLKPKALKLAEGDVLEYGGFATDNRQPERNTATTWKEPRILRVTAPIGKQDNQQPGPESEPRHKPADIAQADPNNKKNQPPEQQDQKQDQNQQQAGQDQQQQQGKQGEQQQGLQKDGQQQQAGQKGDQQQQPDNQLTKEDQEFLKNLDDKPRPNQQQKDEQQPKKDQQQGQQGEQQRQQAGQEQKGDQKTARPDQKMADPNQKAGGQEQKGEQQPAGQDQKGQQGDSKGDQKLADAGMKQARPDQKILPENKQDEKTADQKKDDALQPDKKGDTQAPDQKGDQKAGQPDAKGDQKPGQDQQGKQAGSDQKGDQKQAGQDQKVADPGMKQARPDQKILPENKQDEKVGDQKKGDDSLAPDKKGDTLSPDKKGDTVAPDKKGDQQKGDQQKQAGDQQQGQKKSDQQKAPGDQQKGDQQQGQDQKGDQKTADPGMKPARPDQKILPENKQDEKVAEPKKGDDQKKGDDALQPDKKGDTLAPDKKGDQLTPDKKGDTQGPDQKGDQQKGDQKQAGADKKMARPDQKIGEENKQDEKIPEQKKEGDELRPDKKGDTLAPDKKGDAKAQDKKDDAHRPDKKGDTLAPDKKGDQLTPDKKGDTQTQDKKGDDALQPDKKGDTLAPEKKGDTKAPGEQQKGDQQKGDQQKQAGDQQKGQDQKGDQQKGEQPSQKKDDALRPDKKGDQMVPDEKGDQKAPGGQKGDQQKGEQQKQAGDQQKKQGGQEKGDQPGQNKGDQQKSDQPGQQKGDQSNQEKGDKPGDQAGKQKSDQFSKGQGGDHPGQNSARPGEKSGGQKKDGQPGGEKSGQEAGDQKGEGQKGQGKKGQGKGQPGQGEKGDQKSDQKGEGQGKEGEGEGKEGQGKGEGQGKEGQGKGEGQPGKGQGEGKPSDKQGQTGKPGVGRTGNDDNRGMSGGPEFDNTGGNTFDRDKADLTLRKLEDALKRKEIDPEILKRSGLNEKQFRERAKQILDKAQEMKATAMVGKERKGFGGKTDLRKRSDRAAGTAGNDQVQGLSDDVRTSVPESLRARYEAYQRSIGGGAAKQPGEKKTE